MYARLHQYHRLEASDAELAEIRQQAWQCARRNQIATLLNRLQRLTDDREIDAVWRELEREMNSLIAHPVALTPAWLTATECA